jgi:hypothetical protein
MGLLKFARNIAVGVAGGTFATIPMTAAMEFVRFALLRSKPGTFPPRQVALGIIEKSGLAKILRPLGEPGLVIVTAVTHFGFGAVAGGIYGIADSLLRQPSAIRPATSAPNAKWQRSESAAARGAAFGILVWLASYFGWLPALGITKPQADYPIRKGLILGLSHVVWGMTLGLILNKFQQGDYPGLANQSCSKGVEPLSPALGTPGEGRGGGRLRSRM